MSTAIHHYQVYVTGWQIQSCSACLSQIPGFMILTITTGLQIVWSHNMHLDSMGVRQSDVLSMQCPTFRVRVIGDTPAGIETSTSKI